MPTPCTQNRDDPWPGSQTFQSHIMHTDTLMYARDCLYLSRKYIRRIPHTCHTFRVLTSGEIMIMSC